MYKRKGFLFPVFLCITFCNFLLVGCTASAPISSFSESNTTHSGSPQSVATHTTEGWAAADANDLETLSPEQMEQFSAFVYNWWFFSMSLFLP